MDAWPEVDGKPFRFRLGLMFSAVAEVKGAQKEDILIYFPKNIWTLKGMGAEMGLMSTKGFTC